MPSLPTDVVRVTRPAKIVTRTDSAIQTAYPGARDAIRSPDRGYFESASDASTVLTAKAALAGSRVRRFRVDIAEVVWVDPLTEVPSYQLVDSDLGADLPVMLARIEIDLETEMTAMEVIG